MRVRAAAARLRVLPALLWLLLLPLACGFEKADGPWSVLLLTVDTLRPDYLSANGYPLPTSPYIDQLIGESMYFEQAVAPMARTTPALASLLTGAYPHRTGVRTLLSSLLPEIAPVTELFRERGYQTLAVVTNNVLRRKRNLSRGFDVYDVTHNARRARATTDAALRYLDALDARRPAFVWAHYIDPHVPYHPSPEQAERFDPGYQGPYRLHFGWLPQPDQPLSMFSSFPQELPKKIATHRNPLSARVNEHIRRLYAADVRETDMELERLVDRLEQLYEDRLLVVLTADHGESLGEHDYYFDHGDYVYNAATRVPLAFRLPRAHPLHARGRCAGWVSLVDVLPTLLDLVPLEPSAAVLEQIEGRSLVGCLRGESLADAPVFLESGESFYPELVRGLVRYDVSGRFRGVILGTHKLIWTPFAEPARAFQLYRLDEDPDETRDLAHTGDPALPRLRGALEAWMARAAGAAPGTSPDTEDLEMLRSLGYIE